MRKHADIELICDECGKMFTRRYSYHVHITSKRGIVDKFCSKACAGIHMRSKVPDTIASEYLSGLSLTEIGKLHGVTWSTIRNRLIELHMPLRSKTAHLNTDKNPTKGKGHTIASRKLMSKSTIERFKNPLARELAASKQREAMASGKINTVSKIELAVASEFDRLGIEYSSQSLIRDTNGRFCACVDFMLASGIAVEVNGTYWHSDPRRYPNGAQTKSQIHTQTKYDKKMSALSRLGIQVIEIWELDIRENIQLAVQKALGL